MKRVIWAQLPDSTRAIFPLSTKIFCLYSIFIISSHAAQVKTLQSCKTLCGETRQDKTLRVVVHICFGLAVLLENFNQICIVSG